MQSKLWLCHCKLRLPAILTASQKCSCKQAFLLHGRIAGSLQSKLRLCHCKLRLPAILTASQKYSCKQAFLLHGRIAGSLQGKPMHIRFVENNFAFSAVRKKHKDAFLFSYFSMTKSTKSHLRGFSILLKIFFRRLTATRASKMPRPSNYSLTMATDSNRPRADSDSLLCHVRLWRTSRFRFGCVSGCKHSEMGFILIIHI